MSETKAQAAEQDLTNEAAGIEDEATAELATVKHITDLAALASRPASERIKALAHVTSYVGAKTVDVNEFLGRTLAVKGCVIHTATVGKELNAVDPETGEKLTRYDEAQRVVFKLQDDTVLGFVSKAAESFAKDFIIPLFGQGDFLEDGLEVVVPIKITQISAKKGRTYNFQVIAE